MTFTELTTNAIPVFSEINVNEICRFDADLRLTNKVKHMHFRSFKGNQFAELIESSKDIVYDVQSADNMW